MASRFGRKYACLTNRGTTALTAALVSLDLPPGAGVVFPAAMCSVPVFNARFAGLRPLFADVDVSDGNFNMKSLEALLHREKNSVGAVVPIHMFGRPDNMDSLEILSRKYGFTVVEDAALSLGAVREGRPTGTGGRLSCLSFVRKMLPLEMGGAVLTDDPDLDRRAREFAGRLSPPSIGREGVKSLMKEFHAMTGRVAEGNWNEKDKLMPFEKKFREALLVKTEEKDWDGVLVLRELASLEDVISARRVRAETLEMALSHPRVIPLENEGGSFFAFAVRLSGVSVEAFLSFTAEKETFTRIAYPDIHPVFGPTGNYPGAGVVEKEVMGFPLDETLPVSTYWTVGEKLKKCFEAFLTVEDAHREYDWRGKLEGRMT